MIDAPVGRAPADHTDGRRALDRGSRVVGSGQSGTNNVFSIAVYTTDDDFNEHLYSPNQATRQTENRLYTQEKQRNTTIKTRKCILT